MTKSFHAPRWLVAAAAFCGLASAARATDVKIDNYSNGPVYVAQADNRGPQISHGWVQIRPNESQSFSAPDDVELYLRVQDRNGREITFSNYRTFLNFPAHAARFAVNAEPDDLNVWVLKYGNDLEFSRNIKKGDELPRGWSNRAFFAVGVGSHKLEIKP
ncbi:hypothetical protein [Frigoriglobus tundricola]|uniref:Uncharacterized protein n=1 Tax=Frigoriglobus tundricola TaxID=2774151 RepID=A0A6M5YWP7_9BACT|nr:hypothetical protein [Frigoriglobus tundricola]QJW97352.1 hypothetical protein FTUN_4925 [Frigoriglobus tundricola]